MTLIQLVNFQLHLFAEAYIPFTSIIKCFFQFQNTRIWKRSQSFIQSTIQLARSVGRERNSKSLKRIYKIFNDRFRRFRGCLLCVAACSSSSSSSQADLSWIIMLFGCEMSVRCDKWSFMNVQFSTYTKKVTFSTLRSSTKFCFNTETKYFR